LTFYAFSTENWQRSSVEVAAIMNLFREQLDDLERRQAENERKGFRIRFIGDLQDGGPVPGDILRRLRAMEASSSSKTKTTVNVALNYGGRAEILRAAQQLARRCMEGALQPEQFTESLFEAQLATAGLPPLDLIIRPSGELRLSNFLLWQSAYAEFWFSNVLWPDFSCADLDAALAAFGKRSRRYGNSESLGKMV
jgi:undecaprenyl diphosphate synthase